MCEWTPVVIRGPIIGVLSLESRRHERLVDELTVPAHIRIEPYSTKQLVAKIDPIVVESERYAKRRSRARLRYGM